MHTKLLKLFSSFNQTPLHMDLWGRRFKQWYQCVEPIKYLWRCLTRERSFILSIELSRTCAINYYMKFIMNGICLWKSSQCHKGIGENNLPNIKKAQSKVLNRHLKLFNLDLQCNMNNSWRRTCHVWWEF